MEAYKQEFIEFMVRSEVLTFGDFTTKSGRKTPYFVNTGRYRSGEQVARLGEFYAVKKVNDVSPTERFSAARAWPGVPRAVKSVLPPGWWRDATPAVRGLGRRTRRRRPGGRHRSVRPRHGQLPLRSLSVALRPGGRGQRARADGRGARARGVCGTRGRSDAGGLAPTSRPIRRAAERRGGERARVSGRRAGWARSGTAVAVGGHLTCASKPC